MDSPPPPPPPPYYIRKQCAYKLWSRYVRAKPKVYPILYENMTPTHLFFQNFMYADKNKTQLQPQPPGGEGELT